MQHTPTSMNRRHFTALMGASAASGLFLPGLARAQESLDMVKVLLGVPAGSLVDQIARQVAEVLKKGYAVNTMVENKTGASGILAVAAAKSSPSDGRTVLVAASSPVTVYPVTYKKLPYNPQTDLIPVSTLVTFDLALAVGPLVPSEVTNLKAYYAWCKANPALSNFGSPASGSMPHFLGSMTARSAGVESQHVAYRGPSPAVTDMMGGRVSAVVVPLVDVLEFAKAGKCRILAVTGEKRSRFVPQVPTFSEQGLGEYAMRVWIGTFLPAGTPEPLVQKLSSTLKTALSDKAVIAAFESNADVQWCPPEELKARMLAEQAKWAVAVKELNFTAET
jgi:tripartite-type tricarboxylate transporter receptor subunit TctC